VAGGTELDRQKFKELVLYFAQASAAAADVGFGMVKLNKLLYRADFEGFRLLGHSITGERYMKQEFGPVAYDLLLALDELAAEGRMTWSLFEAGPYIRKAPTPSEREDDQPDLTLFPDDERKIMEKALDDLAALGGKEVSEWSHEQSSGWRAAEIGQEIPYGTALLSTEPLSEAQMERALKRSREEGWASIRP